MLVRTLLGVSALGLGVIAALVVTLNTSIWFLWHAAPAADTKIGVSRPHAGSAPAEEILFAARLKSVKPYASRARRYVLSRSRDTSTLLLIPADPWSWRQGEELRRALVRDGWQVRRVGLAIFAAENSHIPLPSIAAAARKSVQTFFSRDLPHSPAIIASARTQDDAKALILAPERNRRNRVQGAIAPSVDEIDLNSAASLPLPTGEHELTLTLPREQIKALPEDLINQVRQRVYAQFHFTHTSPAIFDLPADTVALAVQLGDGLSLTLKGDTNALTHRLQGWFRQEERYLRPQQQAFRLPDGGIGYELVPGQARDILKSTQDPGCFKTDYSPTVYMCRSGDQVAVSSEQSAAQAAAATEIKAHDWSISMGRTYASRLHSDLAALVLQSRGGSTLMNAVLQ